MNKLEINIEYDKSTSEELFYRVEDSRTLYVRTRSKEVAERVYKDLKLEYKRELNKNASKV